MRTALITPFLAFGLATAALAAPPKLTSSTPAGGSIATRPVAVRLGFDQAIAVEGARFDLQMLGMAQPMSIAIQAVNHDGPNFIDLRLAEPLAPGRYHLSWSVPSAAGEAGQGTVNFSSR